MTTKIRSAFFETNSSSTHSIVIARGKAPDNLQVIAGVCQIYSGEFGWEEENYDDATTKASYCLTWLRSFSDERVRDKQDMLIRVIKRVTGAEVVEFIPDSDGGWGYIDHQSIEDGGGALVPAWESEEKLTAFIFNPDSLLITDNDNH